MIKLVALGDSIIKGVLFTIEENGRGHYSLAEQNIVDQVAAKLHSEVVNLGKMGCTIATGEKILDRHLVHLNSANYVLMCYGGNDSDYNWQAIANHPNDEHHPKTSMRVFERTYERMVHKVRAMGHIPLILSLPPVNAQNYFDHFTAGFECCQKNNVLNWLNGSVNTIFAGHELYNDAVKRVANATDTQLIDISHALGNGDGYLCDDGIHPNVAGQSKIAEIILKYFV
jgi:lysophospholipase L1-like esterase